MRAWTLLASFLAGCGVTSSGSGTGELAVQAHISGKPDSTAISVQILRDGAVVYGANVFAEDLAGDQGQNLAGSGQAGPANQDYRYVGQFSGYVQELRLRVASGDAELEAALEGPEPHRISRPPENALVRAGTGEVLTIEWEAEGKAERVRIFAEGRATVELEGDPGVADLPLAGLRLGDQSLGVERETSVDLAGGAQGSKMRASYRVDNRFTLER